MVIKLLITSIGSLVSQNILDALEYNIFDRRDQVSIVGVNTIADTPNAYRCDSFYKVDRTGTDQYFQQMEEILIKEAPDMILTGRDADAYVLYDLVENNPAITAVLPYGNKEALGIALDKVKTWKFCLKHKLPFAETFVMDEAHDSIELDAFIDQVNYPIIAKPIEGYASKGVFYLRTRDEVHQVAAYEGYMLQEYLGYPEELKGYFELMDGPAPLFAHAPNIYHYSCHTIIGPDGSISPIFISRNQHDSGKTIGFRKVNQPDIEVLAVKFAEAIVAEGGAGALTVQFRPTRDGGWKAQEINMRCNGNTFPRLILGQDDIGLLIEAFLPDKSLEVMPDALVGDTKDTITKTLFCNRLSNGVLNETNAKGEWHNRVE